MREREDRQVRAAERPADANDPHSKEYWTRLWNVFNYPEPTSRRAAILGFLTIPLIVFGCVAIALLFPDAR